MTAKHTPGPWSVAMLRSSPGWREVRTQQGDAIASVTAARDEMEANARLIAAAPELLAFAQAAVAWMLGKGERPNIEDGRAAIAKAEGK